MEGEDRRRLVAGEEVAGVDFFLDVFEVVGEAVGNDDGAGFLETGEIAGDGAAVEFGIAQGWFIDKNVFAFGFDELDDVLDGGGAEVVRVGFHGEAVNTNDVGVLF